MTLSNGDVLQKRRDKLNRSMVCLEVQAQCTGVGLRQILLYRKTKPYSKLLPTHINTSCLVRDLKTVCSSTGRNPFIKKNYHVCQGYAWSKFELHQSRNNRSSRQNATLDGRQIYSERKYLNLYVETIKRTF